MESGIPLRQMIQNLRAELNAAMQDGEEQDLRFKLEDVELELKVCTSLEAGANGGVKFWVLNFGANAKAKSEDVHTVKLKLKPVTNGDGEVHLSHTVDGGF